VTQEALGDYIAETGVEEKSTASCSSRTISSARKTSATIHLYTAGAEFGDLRESFPESQNAPAATIAALAQLQPGCGAAALSRLTREEITTKMDAIAVQMEALASCLNPSRPATPRRWKRPRPCSSWPQAAFSPKARCRPCAGIDPGLLSRPASHRLYGGAQRGR